ncbi:helix-turn-helix domain-containing protein [Bradyrhizobium sp. 186]|uniref:helix-turn-helix domain-containing protein n=1 Tax=Bradyrhizobium sp. 186 TaxID=2782654 RepID=UPI003211CA96
MCSPINACELAPGRAVCGERVLSATEQYLLLAFFGRQLFGERPLCVAARFMIEEGRHSIKVVAQETGFADRERMRRAFMRTFGVPAEALRRNSRQAAVVAA